MAQEARCSGSPCTAASGATEGAVNRVEKNKRSRDGCGRAGRATTPPRVHRHAYGADGEERAVTSHLGHWRDDGGTIPRVGQKHRRGRARAVPCSHHPRPGQLALRHPRIESPGPRGDRGLGPLCGVDACPAGALVAEGGGRLPGDCRPERWAGLGVTGLSDRIRRTGPDRTSAPSPDRGRISAARNRPVLFARCCTGAAGVWRRGSAPRRRGTDGTSACGARMPRGFLRGHRCAKAWILRVRRGSTEPLMWLHGPPGRQGDHVTGGTGKSRRSGRRGAGLAAPRAPVAHPGRRGSHPVRRPLGAPRPASPPRSPHTRRGEQAREVRTPRSDSPGRATSSGA